MQARYRIGEEKSRAEFETANK